MLCKKYQELSPKEIRDYIGALLHAVQSDNEIFELGNEIIEIAYKRGIFDGVVINPINNQEDEDLA